MRLRVLVVDDTIVFRKAVSDALATLPDVEVVGTAGNGKIALSRINDLKPDLLILDIEMPEMNGLEVLQAIKQNSLDVGAIVVSALTIKGGELTMKALELGAFDFVTKPERATSEESKNQIRDTLAPIIHTYAHAREVKSLLRGVAKKLSVAERPRTAEQPGPPVGAEVTRGVSRVTPGATIGLKAEAVGVGVSTGGPNALMNMLPGLPANLGVPIFIVQHMPPAFTRSLAESLDARCLFKVKEAEDGEVVRNDVAYIAPGGRQMKVTLGADALAKIIRVTDDPPENHCRPSADYLFRSLAHHYVGRAAGVIMTGMGSDGTLGLRLMKRNGAFVIAQNEESCVVFGMSKAAIDAGVVDAVVPLEGIASAITRAVRYR
jgi:two-component system, chemotaxis family, protein-glutamate methylesterase/glutaminase